MLCDVATVGVDVVVDVDVEGRLQSDAKLVAAVDLSMSDFCCLSVHFVRLRSRPGTVCRRFRFVVGVCIEERRHQTITEQ